MGRRDDVRDVAKELGHTGVDALKHEAQRRRDDACAEVVRLEHKLSRLPARRWLARAITRWQLGRAQDQCAAERAR